MENWQFATETTRGLMTRRMPANIQMGAGHEHYEEALGMYVGKNTSEMNHRSFYDFWAKMVSGTPWPEIRN